jgi:hypothetical protein
MSVELTSFVTVFQTGQLMHFDWACNALEQANIPFQRREETSGGIRLAMPASPAVSPGTWWTIIVPEAFVLRARKILEGLPLSQDATPGVWDYQPKPQGKLAWQIYSGIVVGSIIIGVIVWFVNIIKNLR